jgi:NAD(P)-dependent dehydrogenase (short-subunit alcohol dehydrogenase family)
MLRLDVTSDQSVRECVQEVLARAGRIDVLVNNVGTHDGRDRGVLHRGGEEPVRRTSSGWQGYQGGPRYEEAEGRPDNQYQLGGGFLPSPFEGFYIASKHAIEGYTETLRLEVKGLGIKISLVEPGFFKTGLFGAEMPAMSHI